MSSCPNCGTEIRAGRAFCGQCGTSIASEGGKSSLQVDAATLTALLGRVAPGARFEGGRLAIKNGDLDVVLEPFAVVSPDLNVVVGHPQLGKLRLALDRVSIGPEGLTLNVKLK